MFRTMGFLLLALPFGTLAFAALSTWRAFDKVRAADPLWRPQLAVLAWARIWATVLRVPYPFALSILHNEGASRLRPDGTYPLGDVGNPKGPALGPGQVLRTNVERLWQAAPWYWRRVVVLPDPFQLASAGNERAALYVAVKVMRESLDAAAGDLNLAARLYNGGPHYNADAIAYANRADTFRYRLGGEA
jgi:hypothetical protein